MTESKKSKAKTKATAVRTKNIEPPKNKIDTLVVLMRRPKGATIDDLMHASGWQAHSVRGAISGAVKKKRGLTVMSAREGDARVYRIAP